MERTSRQTRASARPNGPRFGSLTSMTEAPPRQAARASDADRTLTSSFAIPDIHFPLIRVRYCSALRKKPKTRVDLMERTMPIAKISGSAFVLAKPRFCDILCLETTRYRHDASLARQDRLFLPLFQRSAQFRPALNFSPAAFAFPPFAPADFRPPPLLSDDWMDGFVLDAQSSRHPA